MYWSSGIVRAAAALVIAVVMAAGLAAQKAQRAPKLEKPRKHGIGIVYAIPKDWKVEEGAEAVMLLPPGVVVDAEKEDNPEVIVVEIAEGLEGPEDAAIGDELKGRWGSMGVEIAREPLKEVFSAPGKPGAIYTLDLRKGGKNVRVRAFYVKVKGKLLALTASGETARVTAREAALRAIAGSLDFVP
ncbi:MAG: hypothetical protein J0L64_25170 [Acidobacteria bacterium]|nr:hypothetical protein [Acidobacteriota bacterium]